MQGFYSTFARCETFLVLNSPDILTLCETRVDTQLALAVSVCIPSIQKVSVTHVILIAHVMESEGGISFST